MSLPAVLKPDFICPPTDERCHYHVSEKNLLEAMACLENDKYKFPTIFVSTIARGFNDEEVGKVVNFALSQDFVTSFDSASGDSVPAVRLPQDPVSTWMMLFINCLSLKPIGSRKTIFCRFLARIQVAIPPAMLWE